MSNGIQRKLDIVEKKIGQASKNDLAELGQNVSVNQTVGASPNLTFQKYKENVEKILLRSTLKNRQKKITQQNSKIMKLNAEVEQLIEQNEKKSLDIEVKETELKIQKRNIENLESNLFALKTAKDEIVNELETKKTAYKENSKFIENINLDFIRHDTTRLCTVIGEKGSLRWNGIMGVVEHYKANSKT